MKSQAPKDEPMIFEADYEKQKNLQLHKSRRFDRIEGGKDTGIVLTISHLEYRQVYDKG